MIKGIGGNVCVLNVWHIGETQSMSYVLMTSVVTAVSHLPPWPALLTWGRKVRRRRPILHSVEPLSSMCRMFTDPLNPSLKLILIWLATSFLNPRGTLLLLGKSLGCNLGLVEWLLRSTITSSESSIWPPHYLFQQVRDQRHLFHYTTSVFTSLCWDCWLLSETEKHLKDATVWKPNIQKVQ